MSKIDFYSQIPSTLSFADKISYIKRVHDLGINGISISTLPSNHDIFQFISHINKEFSLRFGISIISPLFYHYSNLEKSILTLNEILGNKNRLFIAFGLGDRITLEKYFPQDRSFFKRFKNDILQLKNKLKDENINLDILIAGSGQKMINFALDNNFEILFNGISIPPKLYNSQGLGIFIMSHFGNLDTVPDNHLNVLLKMLINLPNSEKLRLEIGDQEINLLKNHFKLKKPLNEIKKILPIDILNKIGYIGSSQNLTEKINHLSNLNLKRVVVSQSPFEQWSEFYLNNY